MLMKRAHGCQRSAAEDVDVAKVRDCGGVGLACCRARSVVARAWTPCLSHGGALCHERPSVAAL